MQPRTLSVFGRSLALPAGAIEETVYTFVLADEAPAEGAKTTAADAQAVGATPSSTSAPPSPLAPQLGLLRPGLAPVSVLGAPQGPGALAGSFRPNVIVAREPRRGLALEELVQLRARSLHERVPSYRPLDERPTSLAAGPAHEARRSFTLENPTLRLVQWEVTALDGDDLVTFTCTTTHDRWERDRPRFDALLRSWGQA